MVKTWVVVNLIECAKNVVVPMKFVHTFARWSAYNRRINRNQIYLIFYSKNANQRPNFHLPKRTIFSDTDDACYYGKLVQCFGKFFYHVYLFHNLLYVYLIFRVIHRSEKIRRKKAYVGTSPLQ